MANRIEASASGEAQAIVAQPLAVRFQRELDFGLFTADPHRPGTVVVSADGLAARFRGGARQICDPSCTKPQAAHFVVLGEARRRYTITMPQVVTVTSNLHKESDSADRRIDPVPAKMAFQPRLSAYQMSNNVTREGFYLGGILQVPAAVVATQYHMNLPVIMTYN